MENKKDLKLNEFKAWLSKEDEKFARHTFLLTLKFFRDGDYHLCTTYLRFEKELKEEEIRNQKRAKFLEEIGQENIDLIDQLLKEYE